MTRKKVRLAFIPNDSARKATFKKRKKGLMKKVSELSTLCGINACAIIYSAYDAHPEVWPSPFGAQRVLTDFKMLPEMDQSKKMVNQETFLRQRISKAADHLKRQRKDNREKEMTEVMFQCLVGQMGLQILNIMDLNDLGWLIEQYIKDINRTKDVLLRSDDPNNSQAVAAAASAAASGASSSAAVSAPPQEQPPVQVVERTGFEASSSAVDPKQQWFMDFMNQQAQMGFGPNDGMMLPFNDNKGMMPPFPDNNNNNNQIWPNGFFP